LDFEDTNDSSLDLTQPAQPRVAATELVHEPAKETVKDPVKEHVKEPVKVIELTVAENVQVKEDVEMKDETSNYKD
jgi:hypothetical protein